LQALPSNALEALRGDRKGRYSIRINMQWRVCFAWPDGQPGPSEVEIVDYH
jgi:proteic killer suppression protein